MRERLYWIALGGICFWLPSVVSVVLIPVGLWGLRTAIILPLAGIASLCATSWIGTKNAPIWGWILAGIHILGPIAMLARSVVFYLPSSPHVPGEITREILLYLFLMIPSLLIVTLVLAAMCLRPKRTVY
jgi:hypothetical protein